MTDAIRRPFEPAETVEDIRAKADTVRAEYRPLAGWQEHAIRTVKEEGQSLIDTLHKLPTSRERSLAVTKAEEAVMWAVKGITG